MHLKWKCDCGDIGNQQWNTAGVLMKAMCASKVSGSIYISCCRAGNTIDFYLPPTHNITAAKKFLGKALKSVKKVGYAINKQYK